jgi:hypothetical protein
MKSMQFVEVSFYTPEYESVIDEVNTVALIYY